MPNIKSSAKRDLVGKLRNARNKAKRSSLKTVIKKFDASLSGSDRETAAAGYKDAVKAIDRAVSSGLIHKNNAARKKSRMTKRLNEMPQ